MKKIILLFYETFIGVTQLSGFSIRQAEKFLSSPVFSKREGSRPCLLLLLGIMVMVLAWGAELQAATYYSQGSLDPGQTTSWNDVRGGGGNNPPNFTSG